MMTREEAAVKSCEDRIKHLESAPKHHYGKRQRERAIELERVKIAALRPIGREQVEKVLKSLRYYLETNEEYGVVYIPKFAVEKMIMRLEENKDG